MQSKNRSVRFAVTFFVRVSTGVLKYSILYMGTSVKNCVLTACRLLYTVSQKKSHLRLATTLTHVNGFWYFFRTNVTDKVSNQKTLYQVTSNNFCFCTTPGKTGNTILQFSLKWWVHCLNSTMHHLLNFLNLFDSRIIPCLNLVINAFISGLMGAWLRINEVESATEVGLCYTHNSPVRCLLGFLLRKVMQKH